jgi:hypothetical protein
LSFISMLAQPSDLNVMVMSAPLCGCDLIRVWHDRPVDESFSGEVEWVGQATRFAAKVPDGRGRGPRHSPRCAQRDT